MAIKRYWFPLCSSGKCPAMLMVILLNRAPMLYWCTRPGLWVWGPQLALHMSHGCTTSQHQSLSTDCSTVVWFCQQFCWHPHVQLKILHGALPAILPPSSGIGLFGLSWIICWLTPSNALSYHHRVPLRPVTPVGGTAVSIIPSRRMLSSLHFP
jgi:hypothetical protein